MELCLIIKFVTNKQKKLVIGERTLYIILWSVVLLPFIFFFNKNFLKRPVLSFNHYLLSTATRRMGDNVSASVVFYRNLNVQTNEVKDSLSNIR